MIPNNYLEKVYAGFLGMNAGIRLGAPVEPTIWSYERILKTYGDITDYVKPYINFAADDDANGPVFFLRALYDDASDRELVPQDVARAWLNYSREGVGMFWWGGYGRSTEHTAFLNLKNGIEAPQSGSIAQNGKTMAEQIGGQIFIDTWGLVLPNNPEKAAEYGAAAASVSHDGDGINGAKFFCAAISKAFVSNNIREIIECGLSTLDQDSLYNKVSRAVMKFYDNNPNDFRACREMLENDWGYDKYPGVVHMIPNAGVCILSMLYGEGDFNRTIEIATMCGWDTDCNAGNVGTVLGVMTGIEGIADRYRKPMNDFIVLSSISGYLNILDMPTYSKELAILGYKLANEEAPKELVDNFNPKEIYFDFELPGSTHNMRLSDEFMCHMEHSTEKAYNGTGSLKVVFDRMTRGEHSNIFFKPYYVREDFSDERYSPVFSPQAYSGQTVSMKIYLDQWNGIETMGIAPYIRLSGSGQEIIEGYIKLVEDEWMDIEFVIPDTDGDLISEVGIRLEGYSTAKWKSLGAIYIDEFRINGKANYSIDFAKQKINFGCVSPFSHNHGAWEIFEGGLSGMACEFSESYAGNYFAKDYKVSTTMKPFNGTGHMIAFRAQGAERGYHAGFAEKGFLSIYKNDFGLTEITKVPFQWENDVLYNVEIVAKGNNFAISINGNEKISFEDDSFAYGMYGCSILHIGRSLFGNFHIEEI